MKKAYSIQSAFLSSVLLGMFLLALFIGGVSAFELNRFVQASTKDLVTEKCEKESAQINEIFTGMEKSVRIMESYILDFVSSREDVKSTEWQDELVAQSNKLFENVAENTDSTVAYYFRLALEISENKGLFFSKGKNTNDFVEFELTDISRYPKDDKEHVGWYWEPYEAGTAIWMTPYYNKNNDITMISFVIPMYYQNEFLGVVGMDFDYSVLIDKINNIKIYENGYAHLEKDGNVLYYDVDRADSAEIISHSNDLRVVRKLRNGMDLVVTADHNDMLAIRREVLLKLIITTVALTASLAGTVVVLVHRIVRPIKTLTVAAEKLARNDYNITTSPSHTREIIQLNATVEYMVGQLREREKLQQMLTYRDALTGLRNTTSYKAWIDDFDKKLQENTLEFGVVVFDINYLKETNDHYGHNTGNELIVAASKIIADTFKRSPVFRIGGDEFLVILQNRDFQDYESLIQKLYECCEETVIVAGEQKIHVSIAGGSAVYDPRMDNGFMDVFNRADYAMYENKRKTKGCVVGNG